jgi:hypothetical protein
MDDPAALGKCLQLHHFPASLGTLFLHFNSQEPLGEMVWGAYERAPGLDWFLWKVSSVLLLLLLLLPLGCPQPCLPLHRWTPTTRTSLRHQQQRRRPPCPRTCSQLQVLHSLHNPSSRLQAKPPRAALPLQKSVPSCTGARCNCSLTLHWPSPLMTHLLPQFLPPVYLPVHSFSWRQARVLGMRGLHHPQRRPLLQLQAGIGGSSMRPHGLTHRSRLCLQRQPLKARPPHALQRVA